MKVLITGGSRGIGKEIVEKFKNNNHEVIYPTREQLNLEDFLSINQYLDNIDVDSIDIIINNAGINELSSIENLSQNNVLRTFKINTLSALIISQRFLKSFKIKKYGRIVNIGSIWSTIPFPNRVSYSISKSALHSFTKSVSIEYSKYNILCNMVSPGLIKTEMTFKNNSKTQIEKFIKKIPLKRIGESLDVANIVYYLCVNNNYITGQNIFVDGGYSCAN